MKVWSGSEVTRGHVGVTQSHVRSQPLRSRPSPLLHHILLRLHTTHIILTRRMSSSVIDLKSIEYDPFLHDSERDHLKVGDFLSLLPQFNFLKHSLTFSYIQSRCLRVTPHLSLHHMSSEPSFFSGSPHVKELTPKDFDELLVWNLKSKKCTAVLFYAPWCGHCKATKDEWMNFGKISKFIDVCAFDCEKNKGHVLKIREGMPQLVNGYPSIVFYVNGEPSESYAEGDRSAGAFTKAAMRVCST